MYKYSHKIYPFGNWLIQINKFITKKLQLFLNMKYSYLVRPLFMATFIEYQFLRTNGVLLYSLSVIRGNKNMILKQKCIVLIKIILKLYKAISQNCCIHTPQKLRILWVYWAIYPTSWHAMRTLWTFILYSLGIYGVKSILKFCAFWSRSIRNFIFIVSPCIFIYLLVFTNVCTFIVVKILHKQSLM